MLQRKIYAHFISGHYPEKKDSNQLKLTPSYSPAHGEFENRYFLSKTPTVCMSHVFVYNALNVIKNLTSHPYA